MNRIRIYLGTNADAQWSDAEPACRGLAAFLAAHGVEGATILPGFGLWQGAVEPCAVIELLTDWTGADAAALAGELREWGDQASVLWTLEPIPESGSSDRPTTKGNDHA